MSAKVCEKLLAEAEAKHAAFYTALRTLEGKMRRGAIRCCPDVPQPREGWTAQQSTERVVGAAILTFTDDLAALLNAAEHGKG